jgi:hypothetical protein
MPLQAKLDMGTRHETPGNLVRELTGEKLKKG